MKSKQIKNYMLFGRLLLFYRKALSDANLELDEEYKEEEKKIRKNVKDNFDNLIGRTSDYPKRIKDPEIIPDIFIQLIQMKDELSALMVELGLYIYQWWETKFEGLDRTIEFEKEILEIIDKYTEISSILKEVIIKQLELFRKSKFNENLIDIMYTHISNETINEFIEPIKSKYAKRKEDEKTKILILASNPIDMYPLKLAEEIGKIMEIFGDSEQFVITSIQAVQEKELIKYFTRYKPNILHFAVYGIHDGRILLRNEEGKAVALGHENLAGILSLQEDFEIDCVVFNACFTSYIADVIKQHVGCVVGMRREIDDRIALPFSEGFYTAIRNGFSVEKATLAGKEQARIYVQKEFPDLLNDIDKPFVIPGKRDPKDIKFGK